MLPWPMWRRAVRSAAMKRVLTLLLLCAPALAQQPATPATVAPASPAAEPTAVERLRAEAAAVGPMKTKFAQQFLDATAGLPTIMPRKAFVDADGSHWYTLAEKGALGFQLDAPIKSRDLDADFYWNTRYGSPIAYARALDLAADRGLAALPSVLDFGCGGLGAPRLLASCGCKVVGVDVDPMLRVLYAERGDTGIIPSAIPGGPAGRLNLVIGQWPADAPTVAAVKAAQPDGLDLFLSKNTLKRGYIHPSEPTDPKRLVHLGVDDAAFVAAVAKSLRAGGLFVIYNLCPAPAPADQPYIPWADGHCPFPRELIEGAGLQILDFDVVDDVAARTLGHALGWDQGEGAMDLQHDLFAWYTIARKPPAGTASQPK